MQKLFLRCVCIVFALSIELTSDGTDVGVG